MNPKSPQLKAMGKFAAPAAPVSPLKQVNREDGVQVKEVPAVVGEEVKKAGKFVKGEIGKVGAWIKRTAKKAGNVTIKKSDKQKLKDLQEKVAKKNKKKKSPAKQLKTVDKAVPTGKAEKKTGTLKKGLKKGTIEKGKAPKSKELIKAKTSPAKQKKGYSTAAKTRIETLKDHDQKLQDEYIATGQKTGSYGTKDQLKRLETMNKIPDRIKKIRRKQNAKGRTSDKTPQG